jgi:large subunit ribosomal protein L3
MQVKTKEKEGYAALQLGFGDRRRKTATKSEQGHARKAETEPKYYIREIAWDGQGEYKTGQAVTIEAFQDAKKVDVTGIMKGRGFAGVMKRHGFHGGPKTHGQSDRWRAPGSLGRQNSISKGVPKGKRMAGHMGNVPRTVKNLPVVEIDSANHLLLVRGSIPGPNGGYCLVRRSRIIVKAAPPVVMKEQPKAGGKK